MIIPNIWENKKCSKPPKRSKSYYIKPPFISGILQPCLTPFRLQQRLQPIRGLRWFCSASLLVADSRSSWTLLNTKPPTPPEPSTVASHQSWPTEYRQTTYCWVISTGRLLKLRSRIKGTHICHFTHFTLYHPITLKYSYPLVICYIVMVQIIIFLMGEQPLYISVSMVTFNRYVLQLPKSTSTISLDYP